MQHENKSDFTYKILFLGESDVGKTSIILRYTDDFFELEGVSTYGIDLRHKYIKINNKKIRLDLWDTAGQERFKTITKSYYTKAKVIIFTFDLTSFESFKQLKSWINESKEKTKSNIELVLAGNKSDLIDKRKVNKEDIEKFSEDNKIPYFEISAKTGKGIQEMFDTIVNKLLKKENEKREEEEEEEDKSLQFLNDENNKKGKKCNC